MRRSPATRRVGAWRASGELFGALDFAFLQGKHRCLAEGVSLRGYWCTTWRERSDWTRTSEAKISRAREEPKISTTPYTTVALDSIQRGDGFSERARK